MFFFNLTTTVHEVNFIGCKNCCLASKVDIIIVIVIIITITKPSLPIAKFTSKTYFVFNFLNFFESMPMSGTRTSDVARHADETLPSLLIWKIVCA